MNRPPSAGVPVLSAAARPVRSFVRRNGRMTGGQARALQELWPRFGIDATDAPADLDTLFGRRAPRVLEIGFGNGDTLLALAAQQPERDFLGIEVHEPGVGHVLMNAHAQELTNLRVMRHDAVEALNRQIPDDAFDEILIFFPDPWPKKRHRKRRLIQPAFVELLARKLKPGAILRLATDWEDYATHMLEVLEGCAHLRNCAEISANQPAGAPFLVRPAMRPITRFERRGQRLGHVTRDLAYIRR